MLFHEENFNSQQSLVACSFFFFTPPPPPRRAPAPVTPHLQLTLTVWSWELQMRKNL